MNEQTKTALLASIQHWKENLEDAENNYLPDTTADSCALCETFTIQGHQVCAECPVGKKTKQTLCKGTPYLDVLHHINLRHKDWVRIRFHTKRELDFLISLLPQEDPIS